MDGTGEVGGDQEDEAEEEPHPARPHRGPSHHPHSDHIHRVFDRLPNALQDGAAAGHGTAVTPDRPH
jgi:hypothetical protein